MEILEILQFLRRNKKLKGVSLIELILVIGILSLLASILIFNSSIIDKKIEENEIKLIVKNINNTRNYSITTRKLQSISFNSSDNSYSSTLENENIKLKKLKFDRDSSNIETFLFTKNGTPSKEGSGTIVLKGKSKDYTISVTPVTGKVNLKDGKEEK